MADQTPACGNPDHTRRAPAVARLSWPDGRFQSVTACVGDLERQVRGSLADGHSVLVEPAAAPTTPVIQAITEVVRAHRRAYSSPVRAILLSASDAPAFDELPETLEERRNLPARFHTPHWMGDSTPAAWVCNVCWDEGTTTRWPCDVAAEHGGEVFA
ncbi:hypothetical protein GCM10017673_37670 [Streptosporangium violaceochromogenes]|nr:hypothetical protein GCM10017673_37670 [Streptosporangium violaceochromogenes]